MEVFAGQSSLSHRIEINLIGLYLGPQMIFQYCALSSLQPPRWLSIWLPSSIKMAEVVGAAATLVSIIGFSAQVFDGCVKGFVLLSTAQNIGQDADILRSMLEWEQLRLEQWAEKAGLQDPAKADILMDWKLITTTLQHIQDLTTDTEVLKKKYNLILLERAPNLDEKASSDQGDDDEKASTSRFKRLFGQSAKGSNTAAAKVIRSKNAAPKKLWWAAVDKQNLEKLVNDISHFIQRLHDLLDLSMQTQMQKQIEALLEDATRRYDDVPDLEVLRELAVMARKDPPSYEDSHADDIAKEIERKFTNLLFYAIPKGEIKEVESLLDKGVDLHACDHCGWVPLVRAAEAGQLAIVEMLLKRGADPLKGTIGTRLPLHFAAEEGHEPVVRLLLQQPTVNPNQKDFTGQTALFKAADKGHHTIVELFLRQEGIEADAQTDYGFTALLQALFNRHKEVIKLLLDTPDVNPNHCCENGQTPLWMASGKEDEILEMVLARKDVEINLQSRFKETPLYHTVKWGSARSVQMLLDAGADPSIGNEDERTPLCWAAGDGKEDFIELLLKHHGMDINKPERLGRSPLSEASINGHTKVVRMLLAKGVDIESKDKEGRTALTLAAISGHKVVAKVLLKNKADINTQDEKGNTPLALAAEHDHDAVVRFLLESGADAELPDEDEETPFEKARDKHMDQIVSVFKEVLKL